MDLTEQELAGLSETERAALEAEDGGYDGGARFDGGAGADDEEPEIQSDDNPEVAAGESGGADDGKPKGGETVETDDTAADSQASENTDETPAEQAFRPRYVADLPADFQQRLEGVNGEIAALEQKYRDGDFDFDEFRSQERQLIAKREELSGQRVKAEIAAEQAAQASTQEWEWNVKRFFRETVKAEGIDYQQDAKANRVLDGFVKVLASDPDNAQRDGEWFLQEAHKRTKLLLGIGKAPADPSKPAQKPAADPNKGREKASAPRVSLGDLPQAGETAGDVGGDEFAYLDKLSGIALERALRKLTAEQSERYLTGGH